MDRGDWEAAVHGVAKSQTLLRDLHTFATTKKKKKEETPEKISPFHKSPLSCYGLRFDWRLYYQSG